MSRYTVYSQGEVSDTREIIFYKEKSLALLLNTNGFGANYKFSKRIHATKKRNFEVDFVGVKHPKEVKLPSFNQRRFVFGKLNSVFFLRGGFGYQKEIFRKMDKGSIEISQSFIFGPTVSFLKPIYYEILYLDTISIVKSRIEKFNPSIHSVGKIFGRASFFKGLEETNLVPGAYIKYGFNFEFSSDVEKIRALEGGAILDVFPKKIEIMATEDNNWIYLSLFIAYRFGKTESYKVKKDKKRIFDIFKSEKNKEKETEKQ